MNSGNTKPVIFLAFANEREDEARYLRNLPEEARNIRQTLDFASKNGLCEIVERSNATLHDILDVFQDPLYFNRIAIFHYGGHSNGYQLLLESEEGLASVAYAGGLAAFLGQQDGLKMVFLNGCATQKQAQGLIDAGIPMVIATSRDIDDRVAMEFASRFYNGLARGANVQRAYNEARAAIRTAHGDSPRNLYSPGSKARDPVDDRWPWDLYLRPGAELIVQWNLPEAADNPLFGLPSVQVQDLPPSPYRYLSWFTREQAEIFFGRGFEIRDLYQRVTDRDSEPIILFFGQSGVGKSSVLDAGLLPRLERNYEICYLRRDFKKGLLETLQEVFPEKRGMTLAESWIKREDRTERPLVIILDQGEEAFTRPNPDIPNELPDFWDALQAIFRNPNLRPQGKLILGFRKEWLAETEKQLSDRKLPFSKVLLECLNRKGIIEAISGTTSNERLQKHYGLEIKKDLPEIIAENLLEDSESSIAPTLQILLTKMWEKAKEKDHEHPVFDRDLYQTLKDEGILLHDFLNQQFNALEKWNSEVVNLGLALDILEFHTTPLGTTEERTEEQLQHMYRHQSQIIDPLIQKCLDLYLLERLSKTVATRLPHDILAPLVRQYYIASEKPGQRARRILESRAVDWQDDQQGTPLDESDLSLVEKGENGMRAWKNAEERLVKASRDRRDKVEREKRFSHRVRIGVIFIIVCLAVASTYLWQSSEAKTKEIFTSDLNFKSNILSQDPISMEKSILLAIESFRNLKTSEADQLIRRGLLFKPHSVVVLNHNDRVSKAVFSPDGKYVATASWDNTARLWNVSTGKQIFVWNHNNIVKNVVFSPDGKFVATANEGGSERVWDAATGKQILVPKPNDFPVEDVVFSPDGKFIATASWDKTARLLDAVSGKQIFVLNHNSTVYNVIFSPDGKYVATLSEDYNVIWQVRLWDAATGKQIFVLNHDYRIYNAVFSPDGKYVATASEDGKVRLWDLATGKQVFVLNKDDSDVTAQSVVFSPDGKYIVTTSNDNTARVWDATSGKQTLVLNHGGPVNNIAFSPDVKYVATASMDKTARVWDVVTGKQIFVLNHDGSVTGVVFSPDGKYIDTASDDNTSRIWDISTTDVLKQNGRVNTVVFSPDGKYVATASDDNTACIWDAATRKQIFVLNHSGPVFDAEFSPDGKYVATASDDHTACLWDAATGKQIFVLNHGGSYANDVVFSPSGKYVATVGDLDAAWIWDIETGNQTLALGHDDTVNTVAFSPDGQYVATASNDKTACIWDAATGKQIMVLNHNDTVESAVFSPDGKYLATASDDKTARIWDTFTGGQTMVLNHNDWVLSVMFSPDGKYVATVSMDKTAHIWNAATGKQIFVLNHDDMVTNAVFSPDGKYVATASYDNTAHVWDAASGKQILILNHDGPVNNVVFSPDGKYVATASSDNTAILWIWDTEDIIKEANNRLTRNLNREEWEEYIGDETYHKTFTNLP